MLIGTIQQIWRHPVKSMAGEKLNGCIVESSGIPGDRGWALRDETTGEITNGKRIPLLMQCAARYREEPSNVIVPHVDLTFPDSTHSASDDKHVNSRISEVLDPTVLRTIVKDADQNLGIYATVAKAGCILEGDPVELL
jgi:uncharacterized protein YcbX